MSEEVIKRFNSEKAVTEYAARFPMEMAILRLGGVYPGETSEGIKNPYTGEQEKEYFGNIGEHCFAVAHCADVITNKVVGDDNPQKKKIISRALVHDAAKGFEVMRKKAVNAGILTDAYSITAYETIRPMLETQRVAQDIIDYMTNAGSETGHISLVSFVEIQDGTPTLKTRDNLAEMIVHLADDMTYTPVTKAGGPIKTCYVTMEEKMQLSDFPSRYPFLYKEGFGFDQNGKAVLVKDTAEETPQLAHVKTYAEWQLWVANKIAAHLVSKITPDVPAKEAQQFLKQLVNESLSSENIEANEVKQELVGVTQTAEEALTRLRDYENPVSVVVYGNLVSDEFSYTTDWYVNAHVACGTQEVAERIFGHYAGEDMQIKYAWREEPIEEFPQVNLTRTVSQNLIKKDAIDTLGMLAAQINTLLSEPNPSE